MSDTATTQSPFKAGDVIRLWTTEPYRKYDIIVVVVGSIRLNGIDIWVGDCMLVSGKHDFSGNFEVGDTRELFLTPEGRHHAELIIST